ALQPVLEDRVYDHKGLAHGILPGVSKREYRFDPARAPGEEGDCARGGNCGHGRVPDREFLPDASLPCRERAHLFGTPARFVDSSLGYDLHDPLAPGPAYGRVIGKASHQEGIVDAHEPKTDLPGPPCCIADLRDGE